MVTRLATGAEPMSETTSGGSTGPSSAEDVARLAGVSRSTVSRALRGHPRVSAATKARVRRAAEELRYRPNVLASMLARGETGTIGMVVPAFDKWYFSQVVSAAEEVLTDVGLELVLYRVPAGGERAFLLEGTPFRGRVDGLLLVGLVPDAEEVRHLRDLGTPAVTIGARAGGLSSVTVDDERGAARVTEHLIGLGHRDIGMLSGPIDASVRHQVLRDRRAGFDSAMAGAGFAAVHVNGPIGFHAGIEATIRLLGEYRDITAIFAASDEIAAGVLTAARDIGRRVPHDLSVVGFDDHWLAEAFELTTVDQSVSTHGTKGAAVLVEHVKDSTLEPREILIPPRLIVRGSTAPPAPL